MTSVAAQCSPPLRRHAHQPRRQWGLSFLRQGCRHTTSPTFGWLAFRDGTVAQAHGDGVVSGDDWVTLPLSEVQGLKDRLDRAEKFLRDRPTLAQEFADLTERVRVAEAARDVAQAEVARLRAALAVDPPAGSVLWQVQLMGQLIGLLFERFKPLGAEIRLQRCRVCDLISVEREGPSLLDHHAHCPARQLFQQWNSAAAEASRADVDESPAGGDRSRW